MKDYFYYVQYIEKSERTLTNYPDIELRTIWDFESAESIVKLSYHMLGSYLIYGYNEIPRLIGPDIITNDPRLFLKYRTAFSENEFKIWCEIKIENGDNRSFYQNKINPNGQHGISGLIGDETYSHFKNIILGLYDLAYTNKYLELVRDDYNGRSGESLVNKGWKTKKIDNDYITKSDIEWWIDLDDKWKKIFQRINDSGFYENIPNEKAIERIINTTELKLSDAEAIYLNGQFLQMDKWINKLDLKPLTKLKKLKTLIFDVECEIIGLNFLTEHSSLENLVFNLKEGLHLNDLSGFRNIKELDISNNKITDISPLFELTKLEKLDISQNPISSIKGLDKLNNLWHLKIDEDLLNDEDSTKVITNIKRRDPIILEEYRKSVGNNISSLSDEEKANVLDALILLKEMNINFDDDDE